MPSVSKKQHNLMAAVANNPAFAKKVGIPRSVGEEFMKADKGKKFRKGGEMKESKMMMKKEVEFMKKKGAPKSMIKHEMAEAGMKKGGMAYAKGGMSECKTIAKKEVKGHEKRMHGMKGGGRVRKFVDGGPSDLTMNPRSGGGGAYGGLDSVNQGSRQVGRSLDTIGGALGSRGAPNQQTGLGGIGDTLSRLRGTPQMKKGGSVKPKKMASGGKVGQLSKADGCAVKGKTRGKMV